MVDPGVLGWGSTLGFPQGACFSLCLCLSLSLCVSHEQIKSFFKKADIILNYIFLALVPPITWVFYPSMHLLVRWPLVVKNPKDMRQEVSEMGLSQ